MPSTTRAPPDSAQDAEPFSNEPFGQERVKRRVAPLPEGLRRARIAVRRRAGRDEPRLCRRGRRQCHHDDRSEVPLAVPPCPQMPPRHSLPSRFLLSASSLTGAPHHPSGWLSGRSPSLVRVNRGPGASESASRGRCLPHGVHCGRHSPLRPLRPRRAARHRGAPRQAPSTPRAEGAPVVRRLRRRLRRGRPADGGAHPVPAEPRRLRGAHPGRCVRSRVPARLRGRDRLRGADAADSRADAVRAPGGARSARRRGRDRGRQPRRVRAGLAPAWARRPAVVTAWHAVGPALVLGLAGERSPSLSDWPLYVAALLAQFVSRRRVLHGQGVARARCPSQRPAPSDGLGLRDRRRPRADRARGCLREPVVARTASCWRSRSSGCSPCLRASGGPDRPRARAPRRLSRHRLPARRRRRGRRRVHGHSQPRRRRPDPRRGRRARARLA